MLTKGGSAAGYTGSLTGSGGTIAIQSTGSYVLTASTTDSTGRTFTYSQNITITNNAPNKPTGNASVTRTAKDGKLLVNLSAYATDPDGDTVTLEYSGNTSDSYYAVGAHTVKVKRRLGAVLRLDGYHLYRFQFRSIDPCHHPYS